MHKIAGDTNILSNKRKKCLLVGRQQKNTACLDQKIDKRHKLAHSAANTTTK